MRLLYILPAIVFITCFPQVISGQSAETPLLERTVTVHVSNVPIATALDTISKQSGVIFSYNPVNVNTGIEISANYSEKPLRMILSDVLGPGINFKAKGKYIILKENQTISTDEDKTIEGYIYDSRTGSRLAGASVYDQKLITSAVTNEFGYFSLSVPSGTLPDSIHISKLGYNDMFLSSGYAGNKMQDVRIVSNSAVPVASQNISARFKLPRLIPLWILSKNTMTNSVNIGRKVMKTVQLSLFPPLSTNHFLSGNSVNKVSFNTTVGYVYGVDIAEIGGIMNIDLGNTRYFQGAGLGNITGHNVTGVQIAGVFNHAGNVNGVQAGGVFNISADSADCQISGILNKVPVNKVQISGALNLARSSVVQLSGITNLAKKSSLQVTGVANIAKDADIQISGFINFADTLKKFQLGVVNIADTSKGVSIGLFNFIKKGYHKLEISADENSSVNLSFISGTRSFHTKTGAGFILRQHNISNIIFGVGISIKRSDKNNYDAEITNSSLFDLNRSAFIGNINSLYVGIDHKLRKNISLAAGLTFNLLMIDKESFNIHPEYIRLAPYSITSESANDIRPWIGIRTSIRFF